MRGTRICKGIMMLSAIVALAIVTSRSAVAGNDRERGREDLGPGCAPDRPAIAHRADGLAERSKGENAGGEEDASPIPCLSNTGLRTGEPSIAVTNEGTILFQPNMTSATGSVGLVRSDDQGASWAFIVPSATPARTSGADMNIYVDRITGRAFWTSDLSSRRIDYSDDDGQTWIAGSSFPAAVVGLDHTQVFTGPPPKGSLQLTQGYPNVVYAVVAGGAATCPGKNYCGAHITRSLDGGSTFSPGVLIPFPPECPAPGINPRGSYGLNGVVGRDGTVYLPLTPCQRPYVAISDDAGETWRLSLVADTETIGYGELPLGMDKRGNLYAAWADAADRLLRLTISRDRGSHWSKPMMIAAPGVKETAIPQLVAGARGQVAVSYYGSKNAPLPFPPRCIVGVSALSGNLLEAPAVSCAGYEHETWDTYVTESWDALNAQPLFWSATLNDPAYPTWYGVSPSSIRVIGPKGPNYAIGATAGSGPFKSGGRLDYYGMTMAPNGTPWIGFAQACPFGLPVAANPTCPTTLTGSTNDGLIGLVGRLVRARAREDSDED
jgi:hypothetical protein